MPGTACDRDTRVQNKRDGNFLFYLINNWMTLSDMWHCGRTKQYRPRNNCRPPTWHSKVKVKLEEESGAKRGREGGGQNVFLFRRRYPHKERILLSSLSFLTTKGLCHGRNERIPSESNGFGKLISCNAHSIHFLWFRVWSLNALLLIYFMPNKDMNWKLSLRLNA